MNFSKLIYSDPETAADKKDALENKKLAALTDKSRRILVKVSTVFPFDFFPNTIIVDEVKVNIISNIFFYSQTVSGILIKNIVGVTVSSSLIFGELQIQLSPLELNPDPIKYLWKKDAYRLRRIILGLIACDMEKIDLSKIDKKELIGKVEEIGRSRTG